MISSIWGMRWKVTSNIGKDWGLLPPICEAKAIALSGLKLLISGHARTARHSQSFSERPEVGALYMTIVHPLFMCAGSCSKKSYLCLSLSSTPWLSNAIQQQIKTSSSTSFLSIPRPYCVTGPEKADLFFFFWKGIHISHLTLIIGSDQGLITLRMLFKSWESNILNEVISTTIWWSTLHFIYIGILWQDSLLLYHKPWA